ncbi:hypothetical protein [Nonomuraea basaltis]|uniref:hypothetical protein n=1 Tax=Nonomuraea basaltis TaxID=2495887 RepID=UPI001485E21C|nr:hypothetical protein [Nonomuraea basaltis]TMR95282.1 hypothetical protein EJK15_29495 [Nonomuraea basaltis]
MSLDSLFTAMYNVEELLEQTAKETEIEARDGTKIKAAALRSAFMHVGGRSVKLKVRTEDYRICIRAVFAPSPFIEVTAHGEAPQGLLDAIAEEIRPQSWPKRLWGWFRTYVWHGIIAGLIVAALVAVIGWLVE